MHHYRRTYKNYANLNKQDYVRTQACPFCADATMSERTVYEDGEVYVIPNRVQYDIFEGRRVLEHYMVIPKRHTESIDEMTDAERVAVMRVIGQYERQGFSVYARGFDSVSRSVKHQHTHLVLLENKPTRVLFYIRAPYLLVRR